MLGVLLDAALLLWLHASLVAVAAAHAALFRSSFRLSSGARLGDDALELASRLLHAGGDPFLASLVLSCLLAFVCAGVALSLRRWAALAAARGTRLRCASWALACLVAFALADFEGVYGLLRSLLELQSGGRPLGLADSLRLRMWLNLELAQLPVDGHALLDALRVVTAGNVLLLATVWVAAACCRRSVAGAAALEGVAKGGTSRDGPDREPATAAAATLAAATAQKPPGRRLKTPS